MGTNSSKYIEGTGSTSPSVSLAVRFRSNRNVKFHSDTRKDQALFRCLRWIDKPKSISFRNNDLILRRTAMYPSNKRTCPINGVRRAEERTRKSCCVQNRDGIEGVGKRLSALSSRELVNRINENQQQQCHQSLTQTVPMKCPKPRRIDPPRENEDIEYMQQIFDLRTWDMYLRITEARKKQSLTREHDPGNAMLDRLTVEANAESYQLDDVDSESYQDGLTSSEEMIFRCDME